MHTKHNLICLLFFVFYISTHGVYAQYEVNLKDTLVIHPFKVGVSALGANYHGDLNKTWEKFNIGFNFNLQFEKRKKLMPQINLSSASITGQDPNHNPKKNKYNNFVKTSITALDIRFLYRFTPKKQGSLYIGTGAGLLFFNPKDMNKNALIEDKTSRAENETYSNVTFILPTVVGYRYYINPYTSIYTEFVSLNPQTKYLDNINQLGNHKKNDRLFTLNFGIQLSPSQWIQKSYKNPIITPPERFRKGMITTEVQKNDSPFIENDNTLINIKIIGLTGIKGNMIQLQYSEKISVNKENYEKLEKVGSKLKDAPAKNAYFTIQVSGSQDKELLKSQAEAVYNYIKSIILQSGINPQRIYILYQVQNTKTPPFSIDKITLQVR
jgi:hypothetical protein